MSNKTIAEFLEHHKQFSQFRPASREEAGLFYSEPDQALDETLGTVGHLRMDFGSGGKGFFHTWWPHNEDQFNTGEFKDDLQEVVDALRADGPLKDLSAMSTYCHQNGGAITQDGRSYGYIAETKHYRYHATEGYYQNIGEDGFTEADHIRLRDALMRIEGKFLLSYNDDEFIRSLYDQPGIYLMETTRLNNIKQRYDNGAQFPELIIANYDMHERLRVTPSQMTLFDLAGGDAIWPKD